MTAPQHRRTMPHVAWVTSDPPHSNGSGGALRQAYLLDALAREADVHLVSWGEVTDPRVRSRCASVIDLPTPPDEATPAWRRRMTNVRQCLPGSQASDVAAGAHAREALASLVRGLDVDAVCVEGLRLAHLLPAHRTARWSLTLPYLPSETERQWAQVSTTAQQRLVRLRNSAHARRAERRFCGLYDAVFTMCEEDADALAGPSIVVPNGVDAARYQPSPPPADAHIVFIGRLNFPPNIDGATWFAREVFPRVREQRPDAKFALVGLDPAPEVVALENDPGVTLHRNVPDTRPFLAAARVTVVPLRFGTGTRLKALEAMAAGRPLVGTAIGLAGLGLSPTQACVVDDAATMAASILRLLADDETCRDMALAARQLVERRFTWEAIAPNFIRAVLGGQTDPQEPGQDSAEAPASAMGEGTSASNAHRIECIDRR